MRTCSSFVASALLLALCNPAWAGLTVAGKPKAGFVMTGNVVNVVGETKAVTLVEVDGKLTFTVPMASVTTGIGLRDQHMHDNFVEVASYPDLTLTLARSAVPWPADGETAKGTVTASFTAHGVTREVPVTYKIKGSGGGWKVDAEFPFDVPGHGMTAELSYMGVSFEPVVKGTISAELVDAP